MVLTDDDYARANGLEPMARIISWASVGVDPAETGLAPTKAIPKALDRAGMTDLVEPVRERSQDVAKRWDRPIRLLWIDGSHQYEDVLADHPGL